MCWIQYRADGKVYNESAKTDKKTEAIELLKAIQYHQPGRPKAAAQRRNEKISNDYN